MTKINRIVIQGFKSFGKHTEILLGPKFNVILGPNGSGKSNITDALCFVLGKLSAKGLRAEKQAHLIYDGGKSGVPAKFALVSVHFDNTKRTFPLDTPEVVVGRKLLSNGSSIYSINHKACSRKEVLDLLAIAKIDPNGYNIVLQGDIGKFTEMPQESRRQIIEEIANITVYEEKKRQALLELSKVEEKLREAKIVLTERKTFLDELKTEHDQALRYKELKDKTQQYQATNLSLMIAEAEHKLAAHEKRLSKLDEELKALQVKQQELNARAVATEKEIEEINREIEQRGEKGQVELHKQVENLRVAISSNVARIEAARQEIAKIKQRREQLKLQQQELESKLAVLAKEEEELKGEEKRLKKEQESLSGHLQKLKQKHFLGETASIEAQIAQLDAAAEKVSASLLEGREKQQAELREKDRLEMLLSNIDQRIAKVKEIEAQSKGELEGLKKLKAEFKQVTLELNQLLNEDSSMAARLATLRKHHFEAREELAKLRERRLTLNEKLSENAAVKAVTSGKFPGVLGTVSELGSVNSKYALALDVAAGTHLRDIVVEDEKIAAACIKHLKENRLGVATFLPLNKLKPQEVPAQIKALAKASGVHGFAVDLVKFDPKFSKVFNFVFRGTLVVDNIDVARRIGIGAARMVTLDGDLVELSGAMIGGYRQPKVRPLGFQEEEVSKHIAEVEKRVEELGEALQSLEDKKLKAEQRIEHLRRQKGELEGQIIKTEKSLHLDAEDLSATHKEKEVLKANLKAVNARLSELAKALSAQTSELTSLKLKKEKLRQQLAAARNTEVLAEINSYEEQLRKIQEQLLSVAAHIKNNALQREEMYGKELQRVAQIFSQLDKEEREFHNECTAKETENKGLKQKLAELEKAAQDFYQKYKQLFKKRSELSEELKRIESEKLSCGEAIRAAELRQNTLSLERASLKSQLAGLQEEFKQYEGVELIKGKSQAELRAQIESFNAAIQGFGNVNLKSLEIYSQVEQEYAALLEKREKLLKEKEDVERMMTEIELKKKGEFMATFDVLNSHFKEFFKRLSAKGEAYLELENPENPLAGGVDIKVRLTGKRYMYLRSLSGGEQAMTALAFIFAIQEFQPATFYVLDEVDAALDKQNSEKLAKLIAKYSERAQYIVVSHNDYIIQEADTLFGVSMGENCLSKLVSLRV